MFAILKKELKMYYTSLFSYVYYALFFLVTGVMFVNNCLSTYSTQFGYYVLSFSFIVVVLILPFATMRLFSQERKTHTDQMLFTAPVSTFGILAAKYLATVIFIFLPVLLSTIYPIVLAAYGTMDTLYVLSTYIGGSLVILALISIGVFVSTLTSNTVLAAVINFVMYVCILLSRTVEGIIYDNELFYGFIHNTSLYNRFYDMNSGIVRSGDIIYLIVIAVAFFLLSWISLLNYRQSTRKTVVTAFFVVMVGIVVSCVGFANSKVYDFTYEKLLTLSPETKEYVSQIEEDTFIYYMGNRSQANATYVELLRAYEELNDHIQVGYIPLDDMTFRSMFLSQIPTVNEASIVIASGNRNIYLDSAEYVTVSQESSYSYHQILEIEDQLTSGILYVNAQNLDVITRIIGHGEGLLGTRFTNLLNLNHFEFDSVELEKKVASIEATFPSDTKAVFVNAPEEDYSKEEIKLFDDYLKQGGTMIVSIDPLNEDLTNLQDFLKRHGFSIQSGVVIDKKDGYHALDTEYYLAPKMKDTEYTKDIIKKNLGVITYTSKGIARNGSANGYTVTDLLVTSDESFSKVDNFENMTSQGENDVAGPFSVAAVSRNPKEGTIFLITSDIFLNEDADEESMGANRRFFVEMTKTLLNVEDAVWIEGKDVGSQSAYFPTKMQKSAKIISMVIVPFCILLFGIGVCFARKNNLLLFVLICVLVVSQGQTSYASWEEDEDGIHFMDENGEYVTGFRTIKDNVYFFDGDGNLVKGKFYDASNDAYYYADSDGVVMVGAVKTDDKFYITDDTGKLRTGFVDYDGQRYYFNSKGDMVTGWIQNDGKWYYAAENGHIMTGFINVNGYRYYLGADGVRVSDTVMEIDGETVVFRKDGSVDEQTTDIYPLLTYVNEYRTGKGYEAFSIEDKLQECAKYRGEQMLLEDDGDETIETALSNRGVLCDGGYEFTYGGQGDMDMKALIAILEKDERFGNAINDQSLNGIGLAKVTKEDASCYEIIFVK